MYSEIAPLYFSKGINVIPIMPKSKHCPVKDWLGVNFEETYENYKSFGIGLDVGSSDLVILDIDTVDREAQREIEEVLKDYPTPVMRKGNPNKLPSRFYQKSWQKNKIPGDVVELFCASRDQMIQVVLPPSNHPDFPGVKFEWVGASLLDINIGDLPLLPEEAWEKIAQINKKYSKKNKSGESIAISNSDGSRCNHGSHNKLSEMAVAALHNGDNIEDIVATLIAYDKVINEKVSYFLCPSRKEWKTKDKTTNAYQFVLDAAKRNISKGEINTLSTKEDAVKVLTDQQIKESVQIHRKNFKKLPKLEGFGHIIFDELYKNSPIKRSQLCFMSTLNLISILIGNRLFHRGTAANLYQYGLAPSGFGKDAPFKRAKQILIDSGFANLIGSNSPTSETVVLKLLEKNREQTMFINEAESLLKRINNDRTNMGLRECLTDLYDYGGRMHTPKFVMNSTGKIKEAEAVGNVFSPFLNIMMTSTTEAFIKNSGMDIFNTGFGSRFLYYFEDRFKKQEVLMDYNPPIPQKIKDAVRFFAGESPLADFTKGSEIIPIVNAKITEAGDLAYREIFYEIEDEKMTMQSNRFFPLFSRKMYFINKLVLIHHAMINPADYVSKPIDEKSYRWAKAAIDSIVHNMIQNLDDSVSESVYGKQIQEFSKFIKGRTERGVGTTKMDIGRRFTHYRKEDRRKILDDMQELQIIAVSEKNKNEYFFVSNKPKNIT